MYKCTCAAFYFYNFQPRINYTDCKINRLNVGSPGVQILKKQKRVKSGISYEQDFSLLLRLKLKLAPAPVVRKRMCSCSGSSKIETNFDCSIAFPEQLPITGLLCCSHRGSFVLFMTNLIITVLMSVTMWCYVFFNYLLSCMISRYLKN